MTQRDRQAVMLVSKHNFGADDLARFFDLPQRDARALLRKARQQDEMARLRLLSDVFTRAAT